MEGVPGVTEQNEQFLVHVSPRMRKVAVGFEKQYPLFGHCASSQTVESCRFLNRPFVLWRSLYVFVFNHGGSLIL